MLVNSREVVREGLRAVIEQEPDLFVAAQAATVRDARNIGLKPGVIVTDIDLPDASFDDVVSGFREVFAESSIVIFTSVAEPSEVRSRVHGRCRRLLAGHCRIHGSCRGDTRCRRRREVHPTLLGRHARAARVNPYTLLSDYRRRRNAVSRLLVLGHTNVAVAPAEQRQPAHSRIAPRPGSAQARSQHASRAR